MSLEEEAKIIFKTEVYLGQALDCMKKAEDFVGHTIRNHPFSNQEYDQIRMINKQMKDLLATIEQKEQNSEW